MSKWKKFIFMDHQEDWMDEFDEWLDQAMDCPQSDPDKGIIDEVDETEGFKQDLSEDSDDEDIIRTGKDAKIKICGKPVIPIEIKEFKANIKKNTSPEEKIKCTCDLNDLINYGCKCGAMKKEREKNERNSRKED